MEVQVIQFYKFFSFFFDLIKLNKTIVMQGKVVLLILRLLMVQ